jgi:hypothetical protein
MRLNILIILGLLFGEPTTVKYDPLITKSGFVSVSVEDRVYAEVLLAGGSVVS